MSREDPLGQLGYNFWTQVGRVFPLYLLVLVLVLLLLSLIFFSLCSEHTTNVRA